MNLKTQLMFPNSIPVYGHITTLHPFISGQKSELFHILAIMSNGAINIHVQDFMWTHVFISLGCI